jgi:hypothetical protein
MCVNNDNDIRRHKWNFHVDAYGGIFHGQNASSNLCVGVGALALHT